MLSDDVIEKGFALLCMAVPQSDCEVVTCNEVRRAEAPLTHTNRVLWPRAAGLQPVGQQRRVSRQLEAHGIPLTPPVPPFAPQEELLDVQLCA